MKYFVTDYITNKLNFETDGFKVFAYSQFNYPIYCIHAFIEDSTPDPLEKLDKTIVNLVLGKHSASDIQNILGLPKRIIESRINELLSLKYLFQNEETFQLSDEGKAVFLEGKQQIHRKRTYDFYIDGLSLSPLTKYFYHKKTYQYFIIEKEPSFYIDFKGSLKADSKFFPDVPHTPPTIETINEKILRITPEQREDCRIPQGIIKIEKISYTKIIFPVLIAHLNAKDGNKNNFVFNGYQNIYKSSDDFDLFNSNLKERIKNLSVELTSRRNKDNELIYYFNNNWNEIDRYKDDASLILASDEDLVHAINSFYDLELTNENLDTSSNSIRIVIDLHLFRTCLNKLKLLSNLKRKSDYIRPRGSALCIFLEFYTEEKYLKDLIEINDLLSQYDGLDELDRILKEYKYSKKRVLIDIERFVILEKLNIKEHFISSE